MGKITVSDPKRLAAFVLGNGYTKTWSLVKKGIFSSVIAVEQSGVDFAGYTASDDFVIEFEGKNYAIGQTAFDIGRIRVTQMDRGRIGTDYYRTLFAASLVKTFKDSGPISAVFTVPLDWYEQRDQFKQLMSGEYAVAYKGKLFVFTLNMNDIRVIPEGFGVMSLRVLDGQGCKYSDLAFNMTLGVIEVGTRTMDFSMFRNLKLIRNGSNGLDIGLADVWRSIAGDIKRDYGRKLELHEVDQAIQAGYLIDSAGEGGKILMAPYVDLHMPSLAQAAAGEVGDLWGEGGRRVQHIDVAGGGGPQIYAYMTYNHAEKLDKSHTADAEGAFRYGLMRMRNERV